MRVCALWVVLTLFAYGVGEIYGTGPKVKATKGAVWPKPQQREIAQEFFTIVPSNFVFTVTGETCNILEEAIKRYKRILQNTLKFRKRIVRKYKQVEGHFIPRWTLQPTFSGQLDRIEIVLKNPCTSVDLPMMNMDESYAVNIGDSTSIIGDTIWGVLRGLETFSQILYPSLRGEELLVNATRIVDFPRFSHRGLLIDTSRHFLPMNSILRTLDAMTYNKMNVLHWHITDDQSFPYESISFPDLSAKGAYHPSMVYSQKDVADVIEFARLRGIRVMVEFDTPGHTSSWGEAFPKLLTACYSKNQPNGALGPIDPSRNTTYDFMKKFLKEAINVFPEEYIHLGGDEVDFSCWKSNPLIATFMKENNINSYEKLEEHYVQKVVDMVDELKASSVVWQEVYENGVTLPKETVVHVWIDNSIRKKLMSNITKDGYRALLSAGWYLDSIAGDGDWLKFYRNDAHDFPGTEEQKKLVMGGEACMWGEVVDATNIISRVWPRASAVAERLWSDVHVTDEGNAARRLEEHYCRMQVRGIEAQPPNGPGFCV